VSRADVNGNQPNRLRVRVDLTSRLEARNADATDTVGDVSTRSMRVYARVEHDPNTDPLTSLRGHIECRATWAARMHEPDRGVRPSE
jgi:hypothetical protein